jgi:hypothetical protein
MYLHIGNNNVINSEKIIGIFNIETIKNSAEYKKLIKLLQKENNIINISENLEKTFILYNEGESIKAYISNISSTTLNKRERNDN